MDPEVVKQVSQALTGGAVIAGGLKLSGIIKTFLGPAADEVAERIKDEVRLYRFGRQLKCLEKAEKMVEDAGFTPNVVPIKILFPLLDAASMEEDEDIHTMWAGLLANASLPSSDSVRPSFIGILKEMSPDEAMVLSHIARQRPQSLPELRYQLKDRIDNISLDICMDTLESAQLIRWLEVERSDTPSYIRRLGFREPDRMIFVLTQRGLAFLRACYPPEPPRD